DTFSPGESWDGLRAALLPDANMLGGIASANNFDPLVPGRYARWMEALESAAEPVRQRMLDLMAVTVIERVDPAEPGGVRFEPRPALPRLRWAACGLAAGSPEEALDWVLEGEAQLDRQVILELSPGSGSLACAPGAEEAATLQVLSENPNRLSVSMQASAPGYLVLADVWYPGWQARVDGEPTPVLRANFLFRAVSVPQGEHYVELVYRPAWFYLGALVSALAWAGAAAFLILRVRPGQPVFSWKSSFS
ncbi:MAG TPA: YfhO family protein, partial [Anaerolineales bacterium]